MHRMPVSCCLSARLFFLNFVFSFLMIAIEFSKNKVDYYYKFAIFFKTEQMYSRSVFATLYITISRHKIWNGDAH